MENPIKMDDLGVPLFLETSIYVYVVHNMIPASPRTTLFKINFLFPRWDMLHAVPFEGISICSRRFGD